MKLEYELLINKYGQELIQAEDVWYVFEQLSYNGQRDFFVGILYLIMQSKPQDEDIEEASTSSQLKPTYTPCVLLTKGVSHHNLLRIIGLPENEWRKILYLLLSLFRIAYQRRFNAEFNNPDKWWYWDLSDENKILEIMKIDNTNDF